MTTRFLLPFLFLIRVVLASDATSEIVYHAESLRPLNMPPTFDKGLLLVHDRSGIIVYGPDGNISRRLAKPEGSLIMNAAVDSDGRIAGAIDRGYLAGQIAVWDATGAQIRIFETEGYVPNSVAFAPDHSIWAVGMGLQPPKKRPASHYALLRHYSEAGKLLGAYLPRSSFKDVEGFLQSVVARPSIHIAHGRVGVFVEAESFKQALWVETDFDGNELGRWKIGMDAQPIAFSESGDVYARAMDDVYRLDHASGVWSATGSGGLLIGADQNSLAFMDRNGTRVRFVQD